MLQFPNGVDFPCCWLPNGAAAAAVTFAQDKDRSFCAGLSMMRAAPVSIHMQSCADVCRSGTHSSAPTSLISPIDMSLSPSDFVAVAAVSASVQYWYQLCFGFYCCPNCLCKAHCAEVVQCW